MDRIKVNESHEHGEVGANARKMGPNRLLRDSGQILFRNPSSLGAFGAGQRLAVAIQKQVTGDYYHPLAPAPGKIPVNVLHR